MPLYSYKCETCENEFEEFYTSFSQVEAEEPKLSCPSCGSDKKRRTVSKGTSFQLRGGGWAKTKYEGGGPKGRK